MKLLAKLADLMEKCEVLYGIKIVHGDTVKMKHVKKLRKKLYALKQKKNIYNALTAKAVLIKANASKEITAGHPWKKGTKFSL